MKRLLLSVVAGALLVPVVAGCSDDEPTRVTENLGTYSAELTRPDDLINDLMVSYRKREIGPYANLLAADFVFRFQPADAGDIPDGAWNRDDDALGTGRLFGSEAVTRIRLDLAWDAPEEDVLRGQAVQVVTATVTTLTVDIDGGNTTLQVRGDSQRFAFVPGRESLGEDPARMYLFDWEDLGTRNGFLAAGGGTSWSGIKRGFGRE